MTEDEWLTSTDPDSMLRYHLRGVASQRKLRLFAVASCRRIWHLLTDPRSRSAVDVAEACADGGATAAELRHAYEVAAIAHRQDYEARGKGLACSSWAAQFAADSISFFAASKASNLAREVSREQKAQVELLRDIFINEFRPVDVNPVWLTWNEATIPRIARGIYTDRAFDRLPILADSLEDAGCDNADILTHCRNGGEHVRGCWVIDLLLGKE